MSVDAVRQTISLGDRGALDSPAAFSTAMFTDLIKRVKSLTVNSPRLSQSAISTQSAVVRELNAARGITHVTLGDGAHSAGMIPMTSLYAVNMFVGSAIMHRAYARYIRADHIGWKKESLHSSFDMVRGGMHATTAAILCSSRIISSINILLKKHDRHFTHAILSSAARSFHILGNFFLCLQQVAFGASDVLSLSNVRNFSHKLSKKQDIVSGSPLEKAQKITDFISKRLSASPHSIIKKLMEKCGGSEDKVKEYLSKSAMKAAKRCVDSAIVEYEIKISKKDKEGLSCSLIAEMDKGDLSSFIKESLNLTNLQDTVEKELVDHLTPTQLWGLAIECQAKATKKELKFSTSTTVAALQMAKLSLNDDLTSRLRSDDSFIAKGALKEAEGLISKILSDLSINQGIHATRIIICIINFIGSVVSAIFTGGMGAVAAAGVFLTSNLLGCGLDLTIVQKNLKDKTAVGKYDEWIAGAAIALIVISTLASIVLMSFFSFGAVPLVLVIVGGGISLTTAMIAYRKIAEKRALFQKENPTLDYIKKKSFSLKKESPIDAEMRGLIRKLPKLKRRALKEQIAKEAGVVAEGSRSLCQKDQKWDEDHTFAERLFEKDPFNQTIIKASKKLWNASKSQSIRGLYDRLLVADSVSVDQIHEYYQTRLSREEKESLLQSVYLSRAKKDYSWHFQKMDVTVGQLISGITALEKCGSFKKNIRPIVEIS